VKARFDVAVLSDAHDRGAFSSGVKALDRYFREQATQDVRRRTSACCVAVDARDGKVAGFYTLAAGGVPLTDLPEAAIKKLPRYPSVLVARVGRLAVDSGYRGLGLGAALLWDAATRAARSEVAIFALVVDAKDDAAAAFYRHFGFAALGSSERQFVLPLKNLI
jgi:ribosomal protein S18 acetylase RimI-like enzyme